MRCMLLLILLFPLFPRWNKLFKFSDADGFCMILLLVKLNLALGPNQIDDVDGELERKSGSRRTWTNDDDDDSSFSVFSRNKSVPANCEPYNERLYEDDLNKTNEEAQETSFAFGAVPLIIAAIVLLMNVALSWTPGIGRREANEIKWRWSLPS